MCDDVDRPLSVSFVVITDVGGRTMKVGDRDVSNLEEALVLCRDG